MNAILKEVNLSTIAEGAAVELFQHELEKVANNIADQNTEAKAKRKIVLTFDFEPDNNREEVVVSVSSKITTAGIKGHSKTSFLGKMNGKPGIFAHDTKQLNMFDPSVAQMPKTEQREA